MTAENRRFLLPPIINRILTLLTEQGFAAYVVGGAVRDLLRRWGEEETVRVFGGEGMSLA